MICKKTEGLLLECVATVGIEVADGTLRLEPDRRTRLLAVPALTLSTTSLKPLRHTTRPPASPASPHSPLSPPSPPPPPPASPPPPIAPPHHCSGLPLQAAARQMRFVPLPSPSAAQQWRQITVTVQLSKKYCHCLLGEKNSLLPPRGDHLPNIAKKILVRGSKNMPSAQMTSNGRLLVQ